MVAAIEILYLAGSLLSRVSFQFSFLSLCKIRTHSIFRSLGGGDLFLCTDCLLYFASDASRHRPFSVMVSFSEGVINAINLLAISVCFIL